MEQKKKIKFNAVDVIIVIAVLAVIAVFGVSQLKGTGETTHGKTVQIQLMGEEVSDFVTEQMNIGDEVTDDGTNADLGTITDIELNDAVSYGVNSDGNYVKTSKPGYKQAIITTEVSGTEYEHGVILDGAKYSVGHSLTIRAGKAKIYLRVYDIQVKE